MNLVTLGVEQVLILGAITIGIMGIVDGLVLKKIHLGYGPFEARIIKGKWAQVIGLFSLLFLVLILKFTISYISELSTYCHNSVFCEMTTPITSMFSEWHIPFGYVMFILYFILWYISRKRDINFVPFALARGSQTGAQIRAQIHERIAQEQEPQLSNERIDDIRRQVDNTIPFLSLRYRKYIFENRMVNTSNLIQLVLAYPDFKVMNPSERIAVQIIVEITASVMNKNQGILFKKRKEKEHVETKAPEASNHSIDEKELGAK